MASGLTSHPVSVSLFLSAGCVNPEIPFQPRVGHSVCLEYFLLKVGLPEEHRLQCVSFTPLSRNFAADFNCSCMRSYFEFLCPIFPLQKIV